MHNLFWIQHVQVLKHFQKMYRDVGMAVPKITGTRLYMYGSVQARQIIARLHK